MAVAAAVVHWHGCAAGLHLAVACLNLLVCGLPQGAALPGLQPACFNICPFLSRCLRVQRVKTWHSKKGGDKKGQSWVKRLRATFSGRMMLAWLAWALLMW